jgi:hypothetical protein
VNSSSHVCSLLRPVLFSAPVTRAIGVVAVEDGVLVAVAEGTAGVAEEAVVGVGAAVADGMVAVMADETVDVLVTPNRRLLEEKPIQRRATSVRGLSSLMAVSMWASGVRRCPHWGARRKPKRTHEVFSPV